MSSKGRIRWDSAIRSRISSPCTLALLGLGFIGIPNAQADVTVGSPLTAPYFDTVLCGGLPPPCTLANTTLGGPGARVASPVSGVVARWRISGNYSGTFILRVLRPAGGDHYTGASSSSPVTITGTSTVTLNTNLPIQAGDLVGIDILSGHIADGIVAGSTVVEWDPALADASPAAPSPRLSDKDLLLNADVVPANTITVGAITHNKKKGTATIAFDAIPNPGELTGSGNGVKASSAGTAAISKSVGAGMAQLLIKAKGKKKRKLNQDGKVKLTVGITYTPTGGDPATQSVKVRLRKKL